MVDDSERLPYTSLTHRWNLHQKKRSIYKYQLKKFANEGIVDMEVYQGIITLSGVWCLLYLTDLYFKFYAVQSNRDTYRHIVTENGLSIAAGRCQWYTRKLNRLFIWLGQCQPTLLEKWFDVGVIVSLMVGVASIVFLSMVPINTLFRSQAKEEQILKPVIPGVNLPKKDFSYYIITLFISALLHEFGHAIAAVREGVKINGFGMFMFIIYPGAFVDMHSESLFSVSSWKQLRIFCAGIWHNVLIVITGIVMILSLPALLSPAYSVHEQLMVVSHTESSIVEGATGFVSGDIVTQIDDCRVNSVSDWVQCLVTSLQSNYTVSYKIPQEMLGDLAHPVSLTEEDCQCGDTDNHVCFHSLYNKEKLSAGSDISAYTKLTYCARARELITHDRCDITDQAQSNCLTPYIKHLSNQTRLLVIYRAHKPPVLFYGHPADLHSSLIIGEVVPKLSSAPLYLPYMLENLFKYFISLSGALAILNVVPCYALDGQYIAKALVDIVFHKQSDDTRELILSLVIMFGTALLIGNVLLAVYGLF